MMAALLNGTDERIECGTPDVPGSTDELTIMGWAFPTDTDFRRLMSKATGTNNADHTWMLSVFTGPVWRSRVNAGGSTTSVQDGTLTPSTWQHIACVYDNTNQANYVDAVIGGSPGTNSGNVEIDATAEYWIGANPPDGGGEFWQGDVEDVRVYDRNLSDEELLCIVNSNGHDGIVQNMLLRHPLNDNSSGTIGSGEAHDLGSLGVNGDGVNTPAWSVGANVMAPRRRYR